MGAARCHRERQRQSPPAAQACGTSLPPHAAPQARLTSDAAAG